MNSLQLVYSNWIHGLKWKMNGLKRWIKLNKVQLNYQRISNYYNSFDLLDSFFVFKLNFTTWNFFIQYVQFISTKSKDELCWILIQFIKRVENNQQAKDPKNSMIEIAIVISIYQLSRSMYSSISPHTINLTFVLKFNMWNFNAIE